MSDRQLQPDWRAQRRTGITAIVAGFVVASLLWWLVYQFAPVPDGLPSLTDRLLFALRCFVLATLFCLVAGVEAVAHERLQSDAFDPLAGHAGRRLAINQRYLQNTLEQIIVFGVALFGLAALESGPSILRILLASTVTWILSRFAFWLGDHRSAAMRGLGAPGMAIAMAMRLYVVWKFGS